MFELVNTSLPNGLLPGTHGFATVAMTRGLADNLRRRLEDLSAYVHKTSAHDATYDTLNPVAWSHLILPRGEHVLGRVSAAPFDYTGRTNRLARLVCLTAAEAKSFNAAETLLRENVYFSAPWEGEARWLEPDAALSTRFASPSTRASRKSQTWLDAFGEADGSRYAAGFAALLRDSIRQNGKPLVFVTSQQSDPDGRRALAFIADLIALLPEDLQPSATFSTYPCAIPIGVKCAIRVLRKDDNGYAQAVAGVPVADFAAKAVQNANLLPHDTELEHLAATGNLPAPTAPTEVAPQTAAAHPSATVKAATAETIDVSIDIPPATESDEAIAVTEKDASHRKPKLKQRSGQSAPMPVQGQRFDPLFGQPHKQSNGPLIAAVVGGTILLLCLAAFVVRQSKPQYSSSKEHSVQNAQAETKKEKELRRKQEEQERQEEKKRKADAAAKAKAEQQAKQDRLAPEETAKAAKTTATAAAPLGKAAPLCTNISVIVRCADDVEAKQKFGNPTKDSLSSGSIWYYDGAMIKSCSFTDKGSGKDRSWFTIDSDNHKYELVDPKDLPNAKDIKYCRIWYFNKNPNTLYWVTNKVDRAEFELNPPHNNAPINLVKELFGPDLRVLAQWEAYFGKVNCRAWAADGTNRLDWQEVDAGTFVPSAFIAKCHKLRLSVLKRDLEVTTNKLIKVTGTKKKEMDALKTKKSNCEKQLADKNRELAKVEPKEEKKAYEKAKEAFEKADKEYKDVVANHDSKMKRLNDELRRLEMAKEREGKGSDKAKHDPGIKAKEAEIQAARNEIPDKGTILTDALHAYQKADDDLRPAQARYDGLKKELGIDELEKELEKLDNEIKRIYSDSATYEAKKAALQAEIKKYQAITVAEAQRQWTIHVKVNLGGGK